MKKALILFTLLVSPILAPPLEAVPYIYELDTEFSGATQPSGNPIVIMEDSGSQVKFTLDINNLSTPEHVKEWYFNIDPSLDANLLSFDSFSSGTGLVDTPTFINTGSVSPTVGQVGTFDFAFDFSNSGSGKFEYVSGGLAWVEIVLSYSGLDLDPEDFLFGSTGGGSGTAFSAVHIGGINPNGSLSGKVGDFTGGTPVPEPSTYLVLGSLLTATVMLRRKKLAHAK